MSAIHKLFMDAQHKNPADVREDNGLSTACEIPNILVVEDNSVQAIEDFELLHCSSLFEIWAEDKQHKEDCVQLLAICSIGNSAALATNFGSN